MMSAVAQRLRARLESSTDNDDLAYWDQLWTLEFKLKTIPEHPKQRELITEDLKRIRAKNLNTQQWLEALKAGYKQNADRPVSVGPKTNSCGCCRSLPTYAGPSSPAFMTNTHIRKVKLQKRRGRPTIGQFCKLPVTGSSAGLMMSTPGPIASVR